MTTNVTEIINAISQALGIAYDKAMNLYPSVVKMNIVDNVYPNEKIDDYMPCYLINIKGVEKI